MTLDDQVIRCAIDAQTTKTALLADTGSIDLSHWYKVMRGDAYLSPAKFKSLCNLLNLPPHQQKTLDALFAKYRETLPTDGRTLRVSKWVSDPKTASNIVRRNCDALGVSIKDLRNPDVYDDYLKNYISDPTDVGQYESAIKDGAALYQVLRRKESAEVIQQKSVLLTFLMQPAGASGKKSLSYYLVSELNQTSKQSQDPFTDAVHLHNRAKVREHFGGETGFRQSVALDVKMADALRLVPPVSAHVARRYHAAFAIMLVKAQHIKATDTEDWQEQIHFQLEKSPVPPIEYGIINRNSLLLREYFAGNLDKASAYAEENDTVLDRTQSYRWLKRRLRTLQARIELKRLELGRGLPDSKDAALSYLADAKALAERDRNQFAISHVAELIYRTETDQFVASR